MNVSTLIAIASAGISVAMAAAIVATTKENKTDVIYIKDKSSEEYDHPFSIKYGNHLEIPEYHKDVYDTCMIYSDIMDNMQGTFGGSIHISSEFMKNCIFGYEDTDSDKMLRAFDLARENGRSLFVVIKTATDIITVDYDISECKDGFINYHGEEISLLGLVGDIYRAFDAE